MWAQEANPERHSTGPEDRGPLAGRAAANQLLAVSGRSRPDAVRRFTASVILPAPG